MTDKTEISTPSSQTARLDLPELDPVNLPIVVGTENEHAIDISQLRSTTKYITLDNSYGNTGSCRSDITYIDGEQGILRYRGYPIEQIAENATFAETAMLLIWGELPTAQKLKQFSQLLTDHELLHEGLRHHFEGFPPYGHPMAMLSAMINACSCYHPELIELEDDDSVVDAATKLLSKVRTIAAFSHRKALGLPIVYPDPNRMYCDNFLHMMFSLPHLPYEPAPEEIKALELFLILHADHEQNCSTSTVRMVGSAKANLFASVAAGVCALWGPLHGGANVRVINMLEDIHAGEHSVSQIVEQVKHKEYLLWGFGHRVYKNFDPRARILKKAVDKLLAAKGISDPLLDIALQLEEVATHDDYFLERKLYPNVDFYSGILLRTIGIPLNMFTVMFAIGRMPGWIANWFEVHKDPHGRIYRPRQVYTGPTQRDYLPLDQRR